MARMWRRRVRRLVSYTVMSGLLAGSTFGVGAQSAEDVRLSPRVRTSTPQIASLLHVASARSATFRDLVSRIESTDGIVYIEPGICRHGVRACLSLSIADGAIHHPGLAHAVNRAVTSTAPI